MFELRILTRLFLVLEGVLRLRDFLSKVLLDVLIDYLIISFVTMRMVEGRIYILVVLLLHLRICVSKLSDSTQVIVLGLARVFEDLCRCSITILRFNVARLFFHH